MARLGEFIAASGPGGTHPAGVCKHCGVPGRLVGGAQSSVGMGGGSFIPSTHPHVADHPYTPTGAPTYPHAPLEEPYVDRSGPHNMHFGLGAQDDFDDPRNTVVTHAENAQVSGERWANHLQGAPKPPGRVARLLKKR